MKSINPVTGQVVGEYSPHSPQQIQSILAAAETGFQRWRTTKFAERRHLMMKVADLLEQQVDDLALTVTLEMGKPIAQSRKEVEKCAWGCRYYAEHAEKFLQNEPVDIPGHKSYVRFDPVGPVLAIMPWNFPYWQVIRFVAPGLMAGNVAVLKHASNVWGCGQNLENIFRQAGFPSEAFQFLKIPADGVARVIADPSIRAVTLTGSTSAGKAVGEVAGRHIKKTVLELGGSDAYVVLADANIERAALVCAESRLQNTGQSCIAAKRFIVEAAAHDQFLQALTAEFSRKKVGDPLQMPTQIGPLAKAEFRNQLDEQVKMSVHQGSRLHYVHEASASGDAYFPPTILANVEPGQHAFDEELFGPVAAVVKAKNAGDAIRLANLSKFGLGGAIFTEDLDRAQQLIPQMECGAVFVNEFVKSDPRLPFGGEKESGIGRELSYFGIREFTNIKAVSISPGLK